MKRQVVDRLVGSVGPPKATFDRGHIVGRRTRIFLHGGKATAALRCEHDVYALAEPSDIILEFLAEQEISVDDLFGILRLEVG